MTSTAPTEAEESFAHLPLVPHWIGGREVTGAGPTVAGQPGQPGAPARVGPVRNPATGELIARVALADGGVVDEAVRLAAAAQPGWAATSLARRTEVMFRMRELVVEHTDELAAIICREHGKTLDDARGEVARGRETLDFACGITVAGKGEYTAEASTDVDVHTLRQPLGVVAGITPFNFPVMVPMWMHPIAIATGNAFILKVSEKVPSASLLIARLYQQAGLPDGIFSVVHGDKPAVDALLAHPGIAAVSFVGSTPVARYVQQAAVTAGKRVQALGGANNHAVVLPDADLDFAAGQLVSAAFGSAGQRCMAVPVAVAVGAAADPLVELLGAKALALRVGPGDAPGTELGPVISAEARARVAGYVTDALAAGAVAVVDGRAVRVPGHEGGYFLGPTILDRVTPDMRAYCDEVFGPLLTVLRVDTFEAALDLVNSSPYGNGAAIFTSSGAHARRFTQGVQAGMVGVNVPIPTPVAYYSFGGWKDSLFGDQHAHGPEALRFYTRAKVVTTRWPQQGQTVAAPLSFPRTTD